jgi:hypothetical protein
VDFKGFIFPPVLYGRVYQLLRRVTKTDDTLSGCRFNQAALIFPGVMSSGRFKNKGRPLGRPAPISGVL